MGQKCLKIKCSMQKNGHCERYITVCKITESLSLMYQRVSSILLLYLVEMEQITAAHKMFGSLNYKNAQYLIFTCILS